MEQCCTPPPHLLRLTGSSTLPTHPRLCAAEARRLLPAAEAERLAAQFEAMQAALQPLVGGFRPVAY